MQLRAVLLEQKRGFKMVVEGKLLDTVRSKQELKV